MYTLTALAAEVGILDVMSQFASNYFNSSRRAVSLLYQRFLTAPQLNQIQSHLIVSGNIHDRFFTRKLIAHFAITDLAHARTILELAPYRSVCIWNSVIKAVCENHEPENVVSLCKHMVKSSFLPDNYTFSFIFRSCVEMSDIVLVLMYHGLVIKLGWERYDYVQNGLIHCYASCKFMNFARKLFDESYNRDVVTWTAVINGYLKIGELRFGKELFEEMPNKNSVSWSSMTNGYAQMGMFREALQTFNDTLKAGVHPNHSGLVGALSACSYLGALVQGRWIHAYIDRNNMELDAALGTALVDMYAKCGCINIACDVFEKMPHRDVFAYTSLILGLADHGESMTALKFYRRMGDEGVQPNEVTFISVLSACSRIGLVDEGLRIFKNMKDVYGIIPGPQHYGCLVDLLGRAGLLEQAENVVRRMPMEPDSYVLGALLNACRVHGNLNLGKIIADGLSERCLDHSGVHILLSNIYASLSKWDDVERVRKGMEEKSVKKVTGCSFLEVDGTVFGFVAGDRSITHMNDITYTLLRMEEHFESHEVDEG